MTEHPPSTGPDHDDLPGTQPDDEPRRTPASTPTRPATHDDVPPPPPVFTPTDELTEPVPITVWHVSQPAPGSVMSTQLAHRLVLNYTRPGAAVLDLTRTRPGNPPASGTAGLVVTYWPQPHASVEEHLAACASLLRPGGCLAVVVPNQQIPDQLGQLVSTARRAGLTYLQHVVAAHHLTPRPAPSRPGRRDRTRLARGERQLRVHTDVLVLRNPGAADPAADA